MQLNLHRGSSFISKLILWQTRGRYSHASITLRDGRVIESREFIGVHCLPKLVARKGEMIRVYEIQMTAMQEAAVEHFLIAQVLKKCGYDYLSLVRFISREPVPHWNKKKWFCSELAFEAFKIAGVDLLSSIQAWAVSPELLGLSPILELVRRV